jgi:hypothetical protein
MIKEIKVQMKLIDKAGNAVKAITDVGIKFEELGSIELCGFRVIEPHAGGRFISPPCRQGETRWFDLVTLRGALKSAVESAILREFERRVASVGKC